VNDDSGSETSKEEEDQYPNKRQLAYLKSQSKGNGESRGRQRETESASSDDKSSVSLDFQDDLNRM